VLDHLPLALLWMPAGFGRASNLLKQRSLSRSDPTLIDALNLAKLPDQVARHQIQDDPRIAQSRPQDPITLS